MFLIFGCSLLTRPHTIKEEGVKYKALQSNIAKMRQYNIRKKISRKFSNPVTTPTFYYSLVKVLLNVKKIPFFHPNFYVNNFFLVFKEKSDIYQST